jgi:hypothetical protein
MIRTKARDPLGKSLITDRCIPLLTARWVQLVPIGEDLFGLFYFVFRAREVKFQFPGSARNVNLDGGQTAPMHSQVELFVSLVYSVVLKTDHDSASTGDRLKAMPKGA